MPAGIASPELPTPEEAYAHPVLWAMRAAGMHAVEGKVAEQMGVPAGTVVPRWRPAKHLWMLGDLLLGLFEGRERRLIVTMPPRHGKSALISHAFTSWWLGRRPDDEIILASYGDRLTRGWSRKSRDDLVTHGDEVFGVTARSMASTQEWQPIVERLPTAGNFLATSAGGTATGKGAHLLVVDDLLKGVIETRSKARRDVAYEWLIDEAMTRLAPGGVVIIVGTRWHPDDPIGRLLDGRRRGGDGTSAHAIPWNYVSLPAIAEDDDAMGRNPGEALWPERFPLNALEAIRADREPRSWAGLFQCRPVAVGGEFFKQKWLRYWKLDGTDAILTDGTKLPLDELRTFCTVDLAVSTRDTSDYSVIATWGVHKVRRSEILLLDVIRERMEGPQMIPRMRNAAERWGADVVYVEKTSYHLTLIQQARKEGMLVRELKADRDKKERAIPATVAMEGGQVYLRAGARWLAEFEDELLAFPDSSTHDDQVDVLCLAPSTLIATGRGLVPIVDVVMGDLVETRRGWRQVMRSWQSGTSEVIRLHLSSGNTLVATPGHRIWTRNRGWVPAESLSYADAMLTRDAGAVWLMDVEIIPGEQPVYDLAVDDAHEFYASGVLVHNSYAVQLFRQSTQTKKKGSPWKKKPPSGGGPKGGRWRKR